MEVLPQKTIASLPAHINVEDFGSIDFPPGIKEKLVEMVLTVIQSFEEKGGKNGELCLRLFHPKSEEDIKFSRDMIKSRHSLSEEDIELLKQNGLCTFGMRDSIEEREKSWDFLIKRKMQNEGDTLSRLVNGYAIFILGRQQLTLQSDGSYSTKYGGKTDLAGAVDYLTKTE